MDCLVCVLVASWYAFYYRYLWAVRFDKVILRWYVLDSCLSLILWVNQMDYAGWLTLIPISDYETAELSILLFINCADLVSLIAFDSNIPLDYTTLVPLFDIIKESWKLTSCNELCLRLRFIFKSLLPFIKSFEDSDYLLVIISLLMLLGDS